MISTGTIEIVPKHEWKLIPKNKQITSHTFTEVKSDDTLKSRTKQHFINVVIEVRKTSEQKRGIARVGGIDMGNTPFCTFLSGSTAEYFNEDILEYDEIEKEDENKNGGRKLFKKAEVIELHEALEKKVVGKTQRNPVNSRATDYANAQAVSTIEEEFETKVL